ATAIRGSTCGSCSATQTRKSTRARTPLTHSGRTLMGFGGVIRAWCLKSGSENSRGKWKDARSSCTKRCRRPSSDPAGHDDPAAPEDHGPHHAHEGSRDLRHQPARVVHPRNPQRRLRRGDQRAARRSWTPLCRLHARVLKATFSTKDHVNSVALATRVLIT